MKLPRDISAHDLIRALKRLDYTVTRQRGSHIRVTTQLNSEHHEVVPAHSPIKTGTLHSILKSVATHHGIDLGELTQRLEL